MRYAPRDIRPGDIHMPETGETFLQPYIRDEHRCDGCYCPVPDGATRCGDCQERLANGGKLHHQCESPFHNNDITFRGECKACWSSIKSISDRIWPPNIVDVNCGCGCGTGTSQCPFRYRQRENARDRHVR